VDSAKWESKAYEEEAKNNGTYWPESKKKDEYSPSEYEKQVDWSCK
jgi:hypothetical protein